VQEATHTVSDQEELARLRSALAATGDVVYQWDLITDSVTWSGDASNSLGVTAAGVPSTGSELGALVIPKDVAARSNYLTRLTQAKSSLSANTASTSPNRANAGCMTGQVPNSVPAENPSVSWASLGLWTPIFPVRAAGDISQPSTN
jgi:hypothetical protein